MYLKAKERAYQSIVKIGIAEELKNGHRILLLYTRNGR